jgi:hypothetical protein
LLIFVSGLRLQRKKVIVGYCSHQMLCLAAAKVDAICAGNWRNARAFARDKFYSPDPDAISRKAIWYYCPQALSEYKLAFLDIARSAGVLDSMRAPARLNSHCADSLFSGPQPSAVNWRERDAFAHYLTCLRFQARQIPMASFDSARDHLEQQLSRADTQIRRLRDAGVVGQDRDFREYIDVNRSALTRLVSVRGAQLRRAWDHL